MNYEDDGPVMTIHEVAGFLRFSDSKVYRLVKKGELPGRKICLLYTSDAADE